MSRTLLFMAFFVSLLSARSLVAARLVHLDIDLPNGFLSKLAISERQIAPMDVQGVGRFGFQPTFETDSQWAVIVTLFVQQGEEWNRLERLELSLNGPAIASKTSPSFRIRVSNVTEND
jgi:hypothetical protein